MTSDPTALDWSSDGKYIVAGDRKGLATVFNADTLAVVGSLKSKMYGKRAVWVEDIKW